jgi:preprotein translocase subunit SecE
VQKPPAKGPSFRPSGPRPQKKQQTAAQAEAARQRSFFERIVPRPVRDILSELRKVTWPTREETSRLTVVVIIVAVTIGLALGGVDLLFNEAVERTLLR